MLLTNIAVDVTFPNMPEAKAAPLQQMVKDLLPNMNYLDISLDRVLACVHDVPPVPKVALNYAPPPIYYSETPAVMVLYLGEPDFKPVEGTKLTFAVNTNWVIFKDLDTSMYYLLNGDSWLMGNDPIKGPWMAAKDLPPEFSKLPKDASWDEARKHIPGKPATTVPRVIATTQPSELILTDGAPKYTAIPGTRLMYVNNPDDAGLLGCENNDFYFAAAGRWFRAKQITGPWSAASTDLPAEFAKIPPGSPMSPVLNSIPNTQEAEDAILLASIPHKATIDIKSAKVDVVYNGTPEFVTIDGTTMTYCTNTSYQVIAVMEAANIYRCFQGVWFACRRCRMGHGWFAPLCRLSFYTMPITCPLYNCTYVQVYGYSGNMVYVGYTSGYSGEYVASTGRMLMFGIGACSPKVR